MKEWITYSDNLGTDNLSSLPALHNLAEKLSDKWKCKRQRRKSPLAREMGQKGREQVKENIDFLFVCNIKRSVNLPKRT